jgi:PST family polysaccharide transporter
LNGFSIIIKILIGLISSKIIALFLGASGMALVGNMRNFITSTETLSTLGFQNGIVKYTAENQENKIELQQIVSTVFISILTVSLIFGATLFFFADYWNVQVFGSENNYNFVFRILAFAIPWYAMNIFFISLINGFSKFKSVIYITISGNFIGLLVSIILILYFHILGALIAIIITPSLLFFVSFYFIRKEIDLKDSIRLSFFNFSLLKNLSSYSLMAFVSSFIGPLIYLAIRHVVIEKIGIKEAGFWSAMERISSYYLMFVATLLSVYFLPKLVLANTNRETSKVFWNYYKAILPFFIIGIIAIYFLRFFIIRLLFTKEFYPVTDLFLWQLVGDTLKVASLILGYQFFAKKMTKAFILTEVFSLTILYCSSIYFVDIFKIQGIVIAHTFTYLIYFIVLVIYFRKNLFFTK